MRSKRVRPGCRCLSSAKRRVVSADEQIPQSGWRQKGNEGVGAEPDRCVSGDRAEAHCFREARLHEVRALNGPLGGHLQVRSFVTVDPSHRSSGLGPDALPDERRALTEMATIVAVRPVRPIRAPVRTDKMPALLQPDQSTTAVGLAIRCIPSRADLHDKLHVDRMRKI